MSIRGRTILASSIIVALLLLVATCLGVWVPGIDILFYLLVGWAPFLMRVGPMVHVRWDLLASTAAYALLLIVGAHFFLRWLHREMTSRTLRTDWMWRWTIWAFLLVIMAFTSGIAMVGVVHQMAWLATSQKPLYHRRAYGARIKCASNLDQIGQALQSYANSHGGKLPDDFSTLVMNGDVSPNAFVCPASSDDYPAGATLKEQAEDLKKSGHCSYLYVGKGLSLPLPADRVLVLEALENHDGEGINVLYGDGHVDWVELPEAEGLLRRSAPPTSMPSSRP